MARQGIIDLCTDPTTLHYLNTKNKTELKVSSSNMTEKYLWQMTKVRDGKMAGDKGKADDQKCSGSIS